MKQLDSATEEKLKKIFDKHLDEDDVEAYDAGEEYISHVIAKALREAYIAGLKEGLDSKL